MSAEREIAIRVSHLTKMFKVYHRPADMLVEMVSGKRRHTPFYALSDVSFEVPRGSVVGIMGRNGAGKSTLLKIISGALDKTVGDVSVRGKISSILELGTGFNPEYTGRQNIYLGGLMVGMTREEINAKMDWIIEFSELSQVIDQAFKTYSTGMQARLTFSTAVCIDPDILIVDEALSVGDAKFAQKSYTKINEFRETGRTILMVSHDITTITTFCDHVVILEGGKVYRQGEAYEMGQVYYQLLFGNPDSQIGAGAGEDLEDLDEILAQGETDGAGAALPAGEISSAAAAGTEDGGSRTGGAAQPQPVDLSALDRRAIRRLALKKLNLAQPYMQGNSHQKRIGDGRGEILDYGILDAQGRKVELLVTGEKYRFFSRTVFYEDAHGVTSGFVVRNIRGLDMFGTSSLYQRLPTVIAGKGALIEAVCDVSMWLTNGIYFLSVSSANPYATENTQYDLIYDGFQFEVRGREGVFDISIVNLDPQTIQRNVLQGDVAFKPLEPYVLAKVRY